MISSVGCAYPVCNVLQDAAAMCRANVPTDDEAVEEDTYFVDLLCSSSLESKGIRDIEIVSFYNPHLPLASFHVLTPYIPWILQI